MIRKVMVSLPDNLVDIIDDTAKSFGLTRSAFIVKSVSNYLDVLQASEAARNMNMIMRQFLKDNPPQDDSTKGKVELLSQLLEGVASRA